MADEPSQSRTWRRVVGPCGRQAKGLSVWHSCARNGSVRIAPVAARLIRRRERADTYHRAHRPEDSWPGTLEMVRTTPGHRPAGCCPHSDRPRGRLPGSGQRLPGRIGDGRTDAAVPRAPPAGEGDPDFGFEFPGARRRGVQRRLGCLARARRGERRQRYGQVLRRAATPPRGTGRRQPRTRPGTPDGGLHRGAGQPRSISGRRSADAGDGSPVGGGELGLHQPRCNTRRPPDDHHQPADGHGRAGTRGREPGAGRSPLVDRRRRAHGRHRDRDPHPSHAAGGTRADESRGRAIRHLPEDRLRSQPADRTGDVESGAIRLRCRGQCTERGRSGHAIRASPGRLQQGPLSAGAGQLSAGRRRRMRGHVPRGLPGGIEGAQHGISG